MVNSNLLNDLLSREVAKEIWQFHQAVATFLETSDEQTIADLVGPLSDSALATMRLYGDAVLVEMDSLAKADAAHTAVERLHATLAQGLPTTPTRASVRPDPRRIAEVAMPGKQLTDDISRYLAVNQQATDDQRIIVAMVEQKAGMQSTRMLDAEIRLGLAGGNYFSQRPLLADKNPDARFRLTWDGELGGCLQDRERSASVGLAAAWGDFLQMLDKEQELYTPPSAGGLDI